MTANAKNPEAARDLAEHERSEALIEGITGLLARCAPARIRGPSDRETLLPPSALPRPAEPAVWLDQAVDRGREAAGKVPKPFLAKALPFLFGKRHDALRDEEGRRVEALCRLLGGDPPAVEEAIRAAFEAAKLPFRTPARFVAGESGRANRIAIDLPTISLLPERRSSLTKTGKVSWRNWPERERNEAYASLVASLALLYAALALDAAPSLDEVVADGFTPGIDPRTGEDATFCLVSVRTRREVLSKLRLDRLDPVSALENFESRFEIGKGAALKPVEPVDAASEETSRSEEEEDHPEPIHIPRRGERRAAAAAQIRERAPGVREAAGASGPSEEEIASDALRVAIACARVDGRFEEAELRAIEKLIAKRFAPGEIERRRLDLLREELKVGSIDVGRAAARLKSSLGPIERRLLVEGILEALLAKGAAAEAEVDLLGKVADLLGLPPHAVTEMWGRAGGGRGGAGDRERWLAALELPSDAQVSREVVERSARRILDTYGEGKFSGLGSEFREMARKRREGAEEAQRGLLATLPPPAAPAVPETPQSGKAPSAPPGKSVRDNPDLDAIFGG
jgi:uncharacterized tellurite resistance protein B-like protein